MECNDDFSRGMAQDISSFFSFMCFQDLGGVSTGTALGIDILDTDIDDAICFSVP
jgi:hypothetical protein